MAQYQYATKAGSLSQPFEAADSSDALRKLSGFSDAAPDTGVAAYTPPANPNLATRYGSSSQAPVVSPIQPNGSGGTVEKNPLDTATEAYFNSYGDGANIDSIRNSVRSGMQGLIDVINVEYDRQRKVQMDENTRQDARTRGINLAANLAGSDFASAAAIKTENAGKEAVGAIERERAARIGAVLSNVEDRAQEQFKTLRAEKRQQLKDMVDWYEKRQTGAREDLKTLAASGVALDQLSPDEYDKLRSQSGYDDFMFKAAYNAAKPAAAKIDYQWKIAGNKVFAYGLDPTTGKISTLEQELNMEVPQDYKPQMLDNGQLIFIPENIDPTKPIGSQILSYNTGSGGGGGDVEVTRDLQDAAAAIASGADAVKVRQRFLDKHPKKGDLFLKYTKEDF